MTEFLFNAFITPILMTYNYCCLFKTLKQNFKRRILIGNNSKREEYITQKELNDLYELSDMDISSKYSYIAKTVLMSFFYIPIFPLGIIISFFGFCFFYWLEKYNFANRYKRPKMINGQIAEFYNNFFIIALFVYSVGDIIFLSGVYETKKWSRVNIITFGVLIIFPYHQIFSRNFLKFKQSEIHKETYEKASFDEEIYEKTNPMTHNREKSKKEEKKDKDIKPVHLDNLEILRLYFNNFSDSEYNLNHEYGNTHRISNNEITNI